MPPRDKFRDDKRGPAKGNGARTPVWIAAADNRFGVPILDLTPAIGELTSWSEDQAQARRAISWSSGIGAELFDADIAVVETIDCELRYPADAPLPDGLLFCPATMEDKWVFALRGDVVRVAQSWTGAVAVEATLERWRDAVEISRLRCTDASPLALFGDPVETFDWMIRSHALGQLAPLPVDDDGAALVEGSPLSLFTVFGSKAAYAARSWNPPLPGRPLRSDGAVLVATRAGDLARLRELVASGEPVDAPTTFRGYTPLLVAAVIGDRALVEQLLDLGADPNRRADGGAVALIVALVHGAGRDVLEVLAERGADPATVNDDGFGALHAIAEIDDPAHLGWFLGHGLDVELRTSYGHSAVHIASALGHVDALEALASAGADLEATSPDGTARQIAIDLDKPVAVAVIDRLLAGDSGVRN